MVTTFCFSCSLHSARQVGKEHSVSRLQSLVVCLLSDPSEEIRAIACRICSRLSISGYQVLLHYILHSSDCTVAWVQQICSTTAAAAAGLVA